MHTRITHADALAHLVVLHIENLFQHDNFICPQFILKMLQIHCNFLLNDSARIFSISDFNESLCFYIEQINLKPQNQDRKSKTMYLESH